MTASPPVDLLTSFLTIHSIADRAWKFERKSHFSAVAKPRSAQTDFGKALEEARARFHVVSEGIRIRRSLTQQELATRAGMRRETIYRLERKARVPRANTVGRIARALNVLPEALVPSWNTADREDQGEHAPGESLRLIREHVNVTMDAAARAAGISPATLSRYERGIGRPPRALVQRVGPGSLRIVAPKLAWLLHFADTAELSHACGLPMGEPYYRMREEMGFRDVASGY